MKRLPSSTNSRPARDHERIRREREGIPPCAREEGTSAVRTCVRGGGGGGGKNSGPESALVPAGARAGLSTVRVVRDQSERCADADKSEDERGGVSER